MIDCDLCMSLIFTRFILFSLHISQCPGILLNWYDQTSWCPKGTKNLALSVSNLFMNNSWMRPWYDLNLYFVICLLY